LQPFTLNHFVFTRTIVNPLQLFSILLKFVDAVTKLLNLAICNGNLLILLLGFPF